MLQINNLTKTFFGVFAPILNNLSLSLKERDFFIVIGANGSGKSTLLKTIAGEYQCDIGNILIDNKKNNTHLVTQVVQDVNKGTIPEMTLLENIALSEMQKRSPKLSFYKRYQKNIIQKIQALGVGLESYIDQPLSSLSGGQRQVIATLMALNSGKKLLLLDEHTSALDPKMQSMLMEYTTSSIAELGLTTIMVTHKMDEAVKYGNRLIVLHRGKIVLDVEGDEKSALKINELIELFHKYEDLDLIPSIESKLAA